MSDISATILSLSGLLLLQGWLLVGGILQEGGILRNRRLLICNYLQKVKAIFSLVTKGFPSISTDWK